MERLNALNQIFEFEIEKQGRIVKPKVSIVMPTYNADGTLSRAVISSLAQDTSFSYEVVIVDDGSKRRVKKTLDPHILDDPKISVYRQNNMGVSTAMNLVCLLARGSHLLRLDADDELLPAAVQTLTDHLESNPKSVYAYSDGYWIGQLQGWEWERHSPISLNQNSHVNPWIKRDFDLTTLLKEMYLGHARIYRKAAFMKVGGFDPTNRLSGEDRDFALRLSEIGEIKRVPKILHKYYLLNSGITKTTNKKAKFEQSRRITVKAIARRGWRFDQVPQSVIEQFRLTPQDYKMEPQDD